MGYTASDAIENIKLKAWTSTSSALTDPQLLRLLDDSFRSYIVPFTKRLREEFWVGREAFVLTTDSNGEVTLPNSVASTTRTVAWNNNGILCPLPRIEPETSFSFQPSGGGMPAGFMLRGYTLILLPRNSGIELHITALVRPPELALEQDAGEIESHSGLVLELASTPLAWQASAPTAVDLISNESPFSPVAESVEVVSLSGTTLTLTGIDSSLVEDGFWVSDVGTSPFPNIPIELHPLLEAHVIVQLFSGLGDKRLSAAGDMLKKYEDDLRSTLSPRTQGNSRPLLNPVAPGMRYGRWWFGR